MTQRNKYRTGRRHHRGSRNNHPQHEQALSDENLAEQEPITMKEENTTTTDNELIQVETHVKQSEQSEPVETTIIETEVVEPQIKDSPTHEETVPQVLEAEMVSVGETRTDSIANDISETPDHAADVTASNPKKGGAGKLVLGAVVLASLAGGAYYYAQENQLFGLGSSKPSTPTVNAQSGSSETSNVNQANTIAVIEPSTVSTELAAATNKNTLDAENTTTDSTQTMVENVTTAIGNVTNTAQQAFEDVANQAVELASTVTESVSDTVVSATDTASEAISQAVDSASESASQALDTAVDTVSQVADTVSEVSSQVVEKVEHAVTTVVETVQSDDNTASEEAITLDESDKAYEIPAENTVSTDEHMLLEYTALETRVKEQEAQILALTEQLQTARQNHIDQQAKQQYQQAQLAALGDISRLLNVADFERSVTGNKEKTLKVLTLIQNTVSTQADALWDGVRAAVEQDIQVLKQAPNLYLDQVFKATQELEKLLAVAPFVSAEGGSPVVPSHTPAVAVETAPIAQEGSWLDRAINQVERLPEQAYQAIRADLGGLIKVEKLSNPQAARLSIEEVKQQRATTLQQLGIAQAALMQRKDDIWQASMVKVEQQLVNYYNTNAESTQQALGLVRQLKAISIKSELPALSHTQQALEQVARALRSTN